MLDFRNTNTLWASVLVETLARLGLTTAVLCPGSRSTPLTIAFVNHPKVEAIPVLDERSAGFFALGIARQSNLPVVLVCSSGTAGANFYPAVVEAKESRAPLLVLTADRPAEMRNCASGQTIDQQKLFGSFPNAYAELATPAPDLKMLTYLRQTLIHAWGQTHLPAPGPVHLNCPFRDPPPPLPQPETQPLIKLLDVEDFFSHLTPPPAPPAPLAPPVPCPLPNWPSCDRGLIIAGPAQPTAPKDYCTAVADLSKTLGWPVLAEGLSPLRNHQSLNPYLISTYDLILRQPYWAEKLAPEQVIQLGPLPTSKALRQWLETTAAPRWLVDQGDRNLDPLHGKVIPLRLSIDQLAQAIGAPPKPCPAYTALWRRIDTQVKQRLNQTLAEMDIVFEGKVAWILSQTLPPGAPLFIANSMPVRDVEFFWRPGDSGVRPFFNRGANGIDGVLSTAIGMAHHNQSSVLLTGDLALLHDTNGFLLSRRLQGHLTIVLINNNGGGIFEMLPIAQFDPPFEEFFATPQSVDFAQLCGAYGADYELIQTWEQLVRCLNSSPRSSIRVLEIRTNRKADAQWRKDNLAKLANSF